MKIFRNVVAAIMMGVMGGLLVATLSYYQDNKEGGIKQTLLAVANSFDTVADAYSDGEETMLYAKDLEAEHEVIETFESIEADEPYSEIIRFHVRANSDTEEDQELKVAVKEDVLAMLNPLLEGSGSLAESKNIIVANLQNIYETAIHTIVEQGYDYEVRVYLTAETFPAKTYGDMTFPEGKYQALRIDIGEAKGQNWWCVMYPPLCFIDESTAVVSESGKEQLKETLTPEEYANLFAYYEEDSEKLEMKADSYLWTQFKKLWKEK